MKYLVLLLALLMSACCAVGDPSCQVKAEETVEDTAQEVDRAPVQVESTLNTHAGRQEVTDPNVPVSVPATRVVSTRPNPAAAECQRDANGKLRFKMTQNGKRMTAADFKAWMQRCGVGVAKKRP